MNTVTINPDTYQPLSFKKIIDFVAGGISVKFIPVDGAPGYSHKIIITIDGAFAAKGWLPSDQNPTQKNAELFYNKLVNRVYKA